MHSIDLPPITTFTFTLLVLLFLFSVLTTTSLSSNETLSACNNTFNCGHLVNVSYPFTGGDRPARCGHPDFQLSCVNNSTELTIDSLTYRVLRLDPQRQTLTVARLDLWNQTCPQKFVNSSLVSSVFSFGAGNMDLTIAYHCDSSIMTFKPSNLFQCNVNGLSSDSYFLVGAIPSDPILSVIRCNVIIRLPILDSVSGNLTHNRSMLAEALMEGFNVNYSIPHSNDCSKCLESGGQCGYDSDSGEPICICGDRLCPKQGKNSNNVAKIVGLSIAGVCILSIVIGCFVCFLRQRRNKRAILAKDKSLLTPPSSKSDPTSSINLSQSIPSYFTSKSDLEKGSTYFGVQVFTYTELEEATNHFDPSKELGDGGFGTVYYGILQDGRVVAVKRLYENNFKRVVQFMNEVEILTRLEHQNLVKLYGCTSRRSRELLLVYEYIPNGTVADHLHGKQSNSGLLTWQVRLSIAIETADALSYLHRSDIIHRDVKTNNILLDNDFRVKVADFGLSRLFPTNVTHVSTAPQGTPGYVDPEYYQCYQLTDKSDVYSFGVVLIELISSLPAVDTNRHRHDINLSNMAINKIQNHAVNELIDPSLGFEKDNSIRIVATTIAELAFRCLQQEKDMRPTMEEVLVVLKAIKNKDFITEKAEVVDIRSADIGLLKGISPPLSPDSNSTDKWMKMGNVTL